MALIQCKECKAQVSSDAKSCPQCGAGVPKKTSVFVWIVLFTIVGVVFTSLNKGEAMRDAAVARQEAKPVTWVYQSKNDAMTGKSTRTASLNSINSLSLEAPYSGQNFAQLDVRKAQGKSDEVIFSFEKGQTLCKSYAADCKVMVRFDSALPMTFFGQAPSDGSTNHAFLSPASKFITEARKAKHIKVSIDIYHNGTPVLDFNTASALSW